MNGVWSLCGSYAHHSTILHTGSILLDDISHHVSQPQDHNWLSLFNIQMAQAKNLTTLYKNITESESNVYKHETKINKHCFHMLRACHDDMTYASKQDMEYRAIESLDK